MIESIAFVQYRKLKDIKLEFSRRLNLISGTNGTCKSTLLHIIGNSFQSIKTNDPRFQNPSSITLLNKFIDKVNPKIETLSRGDKKYNNPAEGVSGPLFTVQYVGGEDISFRRHNSKDGNLNKNFRFSIKPQYGRHKKDKLPGVPVVYLGLSRLLPYGELSDESVGKITRARLPDHIHSAFVEQFEELTRIKIVEARNHVISGIKTRNDFSTNEKGIDSNTISSGEDNLSIILTALNCLRHLTESVAPAAEREVESVLLIDEFDATLHPSAQKKLFDLILDYSEKYRIQVFSTTHSLYTLRYAYEQKQRIIYLIDQLDSVSVLPDPSPMRIEMHLNGITKSALYQNIFIPVYTEDEEARLFLDYLLDYISKDYDKGFAQAKDLLHIVQANISADALRSLFRDSKMNLSSMRAICILDGDQAAEVKHHIISLPGYPFAPDRLFSEFVRELLNDPNEKNFWIEIQEHGYSKATASDILKEYDDIDKKIEAIKNEYGSTHGVRRDLSKKHFNKHREFYELAIKAWLVHPKNKMLIEKFHNDLYKVFQKTCPFHSVDGKIWPKKTS